MALGCSENRGSLTLTSRENHQRYRQEFEQAFARRSSVGDLDVVLLDDAAARVADEAGASPASAAIRQIMHIHVLYQPMRGTKADNPSATNASIHWYVFGGGGRGPAEVLEYSGAGFVKLDSAGKTVKLEVRNATLKPMINQGLNDPIGPANLRGAVVARTNAARVKELLAEVKTEVAYASGRDLAASPNP